MVAISCTIIAFNEADRIERTIASVEGLVDEIVVIDSGSTDGTQALAESLGARVIFNHWRGFGPQKRFAEDCAAHDMILNLDADEWLPVDLCNEIKEIFAQTRMPAKSFRMKMQLVYPGRNVPSAFADYHNYVRIYDRRVTRFAESLVHDEVPATPDVVQLHHPAFHQSFRSITHLLSKELAYFNLQKKEISKNNTFWYIRIFLEFPFQFFKYYFIRHHVFGGLYGFTYSILLAFMRWVRLLILRGW